MLFVLRCASCFDGGTLYTFNPRGTLLERLADATDNQECLGAFWGALFGIRHQLSERVVLDEN